MPVLYGLMALLALVVLLLLVPIYVRIDYEKELRICARLMGVPITLLPMKPEKRKKERKHHSEAAKREKQQKQRKPSKGKELLQELSRSFHEDGIAATLSYVSSLAQLAGQAVCRLLRAVTVDRLRLEMCIALGDPADTAVRYGQVCSGLYPALTVLGRVIRVKRQVVRVEPNFLMEKSDMAACVRLHVSVWRLFSALIWLLVHFVLLKDTEKTVNTENKEVEMHG